MSENGAPIPAASMPRRKSRFIGVLLILTAVFGWLLSLGWIVGTWYARPAITGAAVGIMDTVAVSLEASQQLLVIVDDSLAQADASLGQINSMLSEFSLVMGSTSEVLHNVSGVLENDLPAVINGTIQGLRGLEQTTLLVDNTLNLLSAIPFFGGDRYRPEVPLNQSVARISRDLSDLPDSISNIGTQLNQTSESLEPIPASLDDLVIELNRVKTSLSEAENVLGQYEQVISNTSTQINTLREGLPRFIDGVFIAVTLLAAWIALAQIGLFTQGMERLRD